MGHFSLGLLTVLGQKCDRRIYRNQKRCVAVFSQCYLPGFLFEMGTAAGIEELRLLQSKRRGAQSWRALLALACCTCHPTFVQPTNLFEADCLHCANTFTFFLRAKFEK
jgi:hypothetical protein